MGQITRERDSLWKMERDERLKKTVEYYLSKDIIHAVPKFRFLKRRMNVV